MALTRQLVLVLRLLIGYRTLCYVAANSVGLPQSQDNVTIVEGENVTLPCQVQIDGNLTVDWFKDGVQVSRNNNILLDGSKCLLNPSTMYVSVDEISNTYKLHIEDITVDFRGQFTCTVKTGEDAEAITVTAYAVSVLPREKYPRCDISVVGDTFTAMNEIRTVQVGTRVEISCISALSKPRVQLTLKANANGENYEETEIISSGIDVVTKIWEFSLEDDGKVFTCVANSSRLSSTYQCHLGPFQVNNQIGEHTPIVELHQLCLKDDGLSLLCAANASPSVHTFNWLYDNKPITDALMNRYNLTNYGVLESLTIQELREGDDNAIVTCIATNTLGTGQSETKLEVKLSPENFFEEHFALIASIAGVIVFLIAEIIIVLVACRKLKERRKNRACASCTELGLDNMAVKKTEHDSLNLTRPNTYIEDTTFPEGGRSRRPTLTSPDSTSITATPTSTLGVLNATGELTRNSTGQTMQKTTSSTYLELGDPTLRPSTPGISVTLEDTSNITNAPDYNKRSSHAMSKSTSSTYMEIGDLNLGPLQAPGIVITPDAAARNTIGNIPPCPSFLYLNPPPSPPCLDDSDYFVSRTDNDQRDSYISMVFDCNKNGNPHSHQHTPNTLAVPSLQPTSNNFTDPSYQPMSNSLQVPHQPRTNTLPVPRYQKNHNLKTLVVPTVAPKPQTTKTLDVPSLLPKRQPVCHPLEANTDVRSKNGLGEHHNAESDYLSLEEIGAEDVDYDLFAKLPEDLRSAATNDTTGHEIQATNTDRIAHKPTYPIPNFSRPLKSVQQVKANEATRQKKDRGPLKVNTGQHDEDREYHAMPAMDDVDNLYDRLPPDLKQF